ncbi:MAG: hypothetical protein H0X64_05520 [Gemmatimonadaceae bacterium]|nr:hypothetical protein [Gemmatimonadaceae bacterium]
MTATRPPEPSPGVVEVRRRLAELEPGTGATGGAGLDIPGGAPDAPRTVVAALLETGGMRAHGVPGHRAPGFAAFLDGTQSSRIVGFVNGIAIVHGTVAAVVRERRAQRMVTWAHAMEQRIYAPLRTLPATYQASLATLGMDIIDTSDDPAPGGGSPAHPFTLRDAAVNRVGRDRDRLEQQLARRWCRAEQRMLFVDGGIAGGGAGTRDPAADAGKDDVVVATAPWVAGVVKSHRTLYAEGDDLLRVFALQAGERSTVFRITSSKRAPVASWYLRLRDPAGQDPMWGLVRVEVADLADRPGSDVAERAAVVSRWILAEVSPLALPDARWDKMVYGVRDCEQFLRAVGSSG